MLETIEHGGVRELRLARPPANALSAALIERLRREVEGAPAAGARALVLSGAPGWFSGGLDVPSLLPLGRAGIEAMWSDLFGLMLGLVRSPIPVAAAITGHSPAGGAVMAMLCDFRVMAEGPFRIGLNEVAVGLPLPPSFLRTVTRMVGAHRAERMLVGGMMLESAEAWRVGFVDELAPPERVIERAVAWCQALLELPAAAMSETRRMARRDLVEIFEHSRVETAELVERWFSEETQRVMGALVERLARRKGP